MKIAHYEQMMDYLTGPRERFRNGGKPGDLVTIGNKKYTYAIIYPFLHELI